MLVQLTSTWKKIKLDLTPYTKANSRCIADLKVKIKRLSDKNMGEYLWDLEVGKDFFDRTQNVLTLKIKNG